jgi:hypothetical protein
MSEDRDSLEPCSRNQRSTKPPKKISATVVLPKSETAHMWSFMLSSQEKFINTTANKPLDLSPSNVVPDSPPFPEADYPGRTVKVGHPLKRSEVDEEPNPSVNQ